jgi:hypothetical protein
MVVKKKKGPARCISNISHDKQLNLIFHFMTREAKEVYNKFIFHMRIYSKYSNQIFKQLSIMVHEKEIKNIDEFDKSFYEIYDTYYKRVLLLRSHVKPINAIIYRLIKSRLNNTVLMNDNFFAIENEILNEIKTKRLIVVNPQLERELVNDTVRNILESIYNKNFFTLRKQLLNSEPRLTNDTDFKKQVRNGEYLLKKQREISYKKQLKNHELFRVPKRPPKKKEMTSLRILR